MKRLRSFVVILIFFLLIVGRSITAFAINTGFTTESMPVEDVSTFLSNINLSILTSEPPKKTIARFAVNEKGLIAIGHDSSNEKTIAIYTSSGEYQYGYTFNSSGSFGLEWDNDNLLIYFVRSDVAISVNAIGEIIDVLKIQNTAANNTYWNHSVFSTKQCVNNTQYAIQNNRGILNLVAPSYSQLIAISSSGEETVLYDASSAQLSSVLLSFGGLSLMVALAIFMFVRFLKKT